MRTSFHRLVQTVGNPSSTCDAQEVDNSVLSEAHGMVGYCELSPKHNSPKHNKPVVLQSIRLELQQ